MIEDFTVNTDENKKRPFWLVIQISYTTSPEKSLFVYRLKSDQGEFLLWEDFYLLKSVD
jgi:hypothetical protein